MDLRYDASVIIKHAIEAALPGPKVLQALRKYRPGNGRVYVISVGKAAYSMAAAAEQALGDKITGGIIITKYGHLKGRLAHFTAYEAGHPRPDANTYRATEAVLELVRNAGEEDHVILLMSGGASALFELPLINTADYEDLVEQILRCGADISEFNTVRKHLSAVKGGRFAYAAAPASVSVYALSDVLGDDLSVIGSGPAVPDPTSAADAVRVIEKYDLKVTDELWSALRSETPKTLSNVIHTEIIGNVQGLARSVKEACEALGYQTEILTDRLDAEAREAGRILGAIARSHASSGKSMAFIMAGETVVHVTGNGKGGRNQELALSAGEVIRGLDNTVVFSFGSDGTDGPTDAAGGISDGRTAERLEQKGMRIYDVLKNNDAYHALKLLDDLIITGPTGTNINDTAVALIRGSV